MLVSVTVTDNREDEIGGAIRSVVDHVDRVLIVDTGITDRTIERAKEVAGAKLVITKHKWVDFSTARNVGLDAATELGAEWVVIVDSDERLDFGTLDSHAALANMQADVVFFESIDGHYPKEKVLRASSGVRYVGPTHEALIGGSRETLRGATFSELPKTEAQLKRKLTRDVRLLTAHTAKHPNDPRWWYYLGSSYEGVGAHLRAAEAFGECAARRKIGNEAAWAAYKQAEQLFILKRFDEALAAAARGMGANATFAECAWIAAIATAKLGRSDQAIAWARIAEAVGRYKGCGPERAYFRHLPALYELPYDVLRSTLPAGPTKKQAEADFHAAKRVRIGVTNERDLDRLSVSKGAHNRYEARSMLRPSTLADLCPSARHVKIRFEPPNGYRSMNPSITRHNGELWCVVRAVNYSMSGRKYTIDDADGVVRTENYLGRLRPNGAFVDPTPMRDLDPSPRQKSNILGYEDVRLVSIDGPDGTVLAASATVCDRDPDGRRLIARLHLDGGGNVERADVQPSNQLHEKNWMPLAVDGEFTYIYSLDPTAILPGPLRACPFALEHLRGGAALVLDRSYLCVTHEVIETDEGRIYLHRFVRLDKKWNVTAVSPAWVFAHHGIEFCAGIAWDNKGRIGISYGIEDREAWITWVDAKEIKAMKWIRP